MSISAPPDTQPSPPPVPRPTAPPRSRFRRLLTAMLILAAVLGVMVLFAPAIVARTFLKESVVGMAGGSIDGKLEVETLGLGWFAPVVMRDVKLTGPQGELIATVPLIRTDKTLYSLARAGGDYGTITVEKPKLNIVIDGESSNLERALDKILNAPENSSPTRAGMHLDIVDGEATLSHAQMPEKAKFENLTATVVIPPSKSESITATGKFDAGQGGASFDVNMGESMRATVRANQLPLESFAAVVKRFGRGAEAKGRLNADIGASREAGILALSGHASIDGLDAVGPWSEGQHLMVNRLAADAKEVRLGNGKLTLTNATLDGDVGRVRATAEISTVEPINELFSTPGLNVDLNLDVAKLANAAPKLLRLKPGTSLTEGHLKASVESHQQAGKVVWSGNMETTALRGVRDGKPIGWDKPMLFAGVGHLRDADGFPVFEKLTWEADFIGLVAAGSVEQFAIDARVDLDRLGVRLAEFIDLGGSSLGGQGALAVECKPGPDGTFRLGATMEATDFRYTDINNHQVREPKLTATLAATGKYAPKNPLRVDAARATVSAGQDQLVAELVSAIPDLKVAKTGSANVTLDGELARWHARIVEFVPSLADYKVAGQGPFRANLALTPDAYALTGGAAEWNNFRFDGAGVHLDEPKVTLKTNVTYPRAGGSVAVSDFYLNSDTAVISTPRADVVFSPFSARTTADVTAKLNRVQQALQLKSAPMNGTAIGKVKIEPQQGPLVFDADFKVTDFIYGDPAKPTWREPWVTAKAVGFYNGAKSELDLRTMELARDGLALKGDAHLEDIKGAMVLDSKGTLIYDLARLEPQLKALVGPTASARGEGSRPFTIQGPLNDLDKLVAQAGLSWEQLRAYGFVIEKSELTATARGGDLRTTPIVADFGGGRVRLEPTIDLTSPGTIMTLRPGPMIEKTKLTPEACASAIGYALPAFANAAQAAGEISFDLEDNRIPLSKPDASTIKGMLTVHNADVSAGPMVEKILGVLGVERTSLKLSGEQKVPVEFKEGRVYHKNFGITVGKSEIISSGSVGVDQTVDLTLDMPVPPKLINQALAKNPRIKEALDGKRIKVPVRGTLAQPVVDERGAAAAVDGLLRGVARDVIRDGTDDLKEKARDKLRGELDKLLPFGKRK